MAEPDPTKDAQLPMKRASSEDDGFDAEDFGDAGDFGAGGFDDGDGFDGAGDDAAGFGDDGGAWDDGGGGWGDEAGDGGGDWGELTQGDNAADLTDQIPADIKARVKEDIEELKLISRFDAAAPDFGGGSRITVRMSFPVETLALGAEQSRAWSLDPSKVITVALDFPPHYFNIAQHTQIGVSVGQTASTEAKQDVLTGFALGWTIENRLKTQFLQTLGSALVPRPYKFADVQEVMDISGVSFPVAQHALQESHGHVSSAVEMLVGGVSRTKLVRQASAAEEDAEAKIRAKRLKGEKSEVIRLCKKFKLEPDVVKLALQLETTESRAALLLANDHARQELLDIAAGVDGQGPPSLVRQASKGRPPLDQIALQNQFAKHNFLVRIMLFTEKTLRQCHQFCIICGGELQYVGLKPAVCDRDLCKMGFEDFGLGFDLGSEIISHMEIMDLFISAAYSACKANRMHFVTPINVSVTDPKTKEEHTFKKKGAEELKVEEQHDKLDSARVLKCLEACPAVSEMKQFAIDGNLEAELKKRDPLLFPLLRWLITSARTHIRKLSPEESVAEMKTEHQFVMLSASPETEAEFQQLRQAAALKKKGKGLVTAFHGSSTGNWHSILRTGLKNMSGTKYMTTGQAYGPGIYMALQSSTSLGYCRHNPSWPKSMFGATIKILAICEVVNHPDLKKPNPYYVVQNEKWVCTRFLCIYSGSSSINVQIKDIENKLPKLAGD